MKDFQEINNKDSRYFPIGVLRLANNVSIDILRIPLFSEYRFPAFCEQAAAELKLTKDSECDDMVERKFANLLTAVLERQITVLKHERIAALLIDIAGNGGGTNWVEPGADIDG